MKNILKLLLITAVALNFVSCRKTDIIYKNTNTVVTIDVPTAAWQYSISLEEEKNPSLKYQGNYYKAEVSMPEITKSVYDEGIVKMYRVYDLDGMQTEMPYSRQLEEYDTETGIRYFWTESVDYEFGIGKIIIYYTVSDFDYEDDELFVPSAMKFRCVISQ